VIGTIRLFLLLEGASFFLAALVHFGVLASGYEDGGAAVAESVIGTVLLIGFALTWAAPAATRAIGLAAQGFGLLGTMVGTYLAFVVGPSTLPDRLYHVGILSALAWGLVVAARAPAGPSRDEVVKSAS
jgi:hypothetical protein